MAMSLDQIEVGHQAYLEEGGEAFGAVRETADAATIVVYVENGGDFIVPLSTVRSAHDGKVVFEYQRLPPAMREAIEHAHEAEVPGL